jgi:hypothetical protein
MAGPGGEAPSPNLSGIEPGDGFDLARTPDSTPAEAVRPAAAPQERNDHSTMVEQANLNFGRQDDAGSPIAEHGGRVFTVGTDIPTTGHAAAGSLPDPAHAAALPEATGFEAAPAPAPAAAAPAMPAFVDAAPAAEATRAETAHPASVPAVVHDSGAAHAAAMTAAPAAAPADHTAGPAAAPFPADATVAPAEAATEVKEPAAGMPADTAAPGTAASVDHGNSASAGAERGNSANTADTDTASHGNSGKDASADAGHGNSANTGNDPGHGNSADAGNDPSAGADAGNSGNADHGNSANAGTDAAADKSGQGNSGASGTSGGQSGDTGSGHASGSSDVTDQSSNNSDSGQGTADAGNANPATDGGNANQAAESGGGNSAAAPDPGQGASDVQVADPSPPAVVDTAAGTFEIACDHHYSGSNAGSDLFIFDHGAGNVSIDGGTGSQWVDVIQVNMGNGPGAKGSGWTLEVDGKMVQNKAAHGEADVSGHQGTIHTGSGDVSFTNIEKIEW